MSEHHASSPTQHASVRETLHGTTRSHIALGYGALGGLITWFLHLCVVYFLVGPVCYYGGTWTMHLASAVLLIVAVGAALVSFRYWRRATSTFARDLEARGGWLGFLTLFGMASGAIAALAIVAQWVPIFIYSPCAGA